MCRLLGYVSQDKQTFNSAVGSDFAEFVTLSSVHCDGWGVATGVRVPNTPQDAYPRNPEDAKVHLETKDVHIWFGQRLIIEKVNLSFPENSVTALIGPSGCGKSTFIRTLNRMHEFIPGAALAGQILYDGQDIYDAQVDPVDIRVQIGMVFQKPNPFPTMSIKENVLSGLHLAQIKYENPDEIVRNWIAKWI